MLAALVCLAVPCTAAAQVSVVLKDGRATVIAHDATLRQVLAEWARVGQTRIVNLEKVPGGPMTIELRDLPEARALTVLLQSVAGYIAAPRPMDVPNASRFDRILILPTSVAAAAPVAMRPATYTPQPPTVFQVPDPTALANDEPGETPEVAPAPVFPGSGLPPGATPGSAPVQGPPVQQYAPPPVPSPAAQPQAPPLLPTPGQMTSPAPGVLPVPAPQQPPQQPQR